MKQPFSVFSWHRPFLPELKQLIFDITDGEPGKALVITPNQRPWRYLSDLYAQARKPGLLPRMLAVADVVSVWSAASSPGPYCMANSLDQIWFLAETCRELAESDPELARHFAAMPMDQFLPWGFRLASLFEEIMRQGREPADICQLEGEVEPLAESLLGALGRIGQLWREKLLAQAIPLMTPGLENLRAAQNCGAIPEYLRPRPGRPVLIAGFSILNGAEDDLFRSLWQEGAMICLHTDPGLATGSEIHPACSGHADWLRRWQATARLIGPEGKSEPEYSFFAGYDLHSQISRFTEDLAKDASGTKAIILPSADLLMPVLHHLPDKEINISMGYPLRRSQLFSFLDDLLRLELRRQSDGRYYWQDLLRLFSQPFLRMLSQGREAKLGKPLALLKNAIRSGTAYVNLAAVQAEIGPRLSEQEADLLGRVLGLITERVAAINTPGQLAASLAAICEFLVEHGGRAWKRFPLDLEAISRLQNNVLPVLAASRMAASEFPKPVLFDMLVTLLGQERIPFEADPLVGAQILGLLETRLLHFDNVYVLDATEDRLPGLNRQDPLLPDSLRSVAGLPDASTRQKVIAYNLFRLLASAKKARFYWAEGAGLPDLGRTATGRSRYVEQLIWAREQREGRLLTCEDEGLDAATAQARLNRTEPAAIGRSARLDEKMQAWLQGSLSPTQLNVYLNCPARFAYEKILRLQPLREINEGDDGGAVGRCIHNALAALLAPCKNRTARLCEIERASLEQALEEQLADLRKEKALPFDSLLMLEKAGRRRLATYLEQMTDPVTVRGLEIERETGIALAGSLYLFNGRLDRLDERGAGQVIVDYKTGRLHLPAKGTWQDSEFFAALQEYMAEHPAEFDEKADELLAGLRERLPDMQMPVYMLMELAETGELPADAVFVDLRDSCKEKSFFAEVEDGEMERALDFCKTGLAFLIRHMQSARSFAPTGEGCGYCPYAPICNS